ncbi:hypothetical protein [Shewanella sp.]|uniref:hypothetical protein n=1 Tax=Shewanella sp. TaxID=50422 RepID=UPI003A88913D
MKYLFLCFTLIMMLGQIMLPVEASALVPEMQHTNMSHATSAITKSDCCKEQKHCTNCDIDMDCCNIDNCFNNFSPAAIPFTSNQPVLAVSSQQVELQSWSLQTTILFQQTPPPTFYQI